MNYVYSVWVNGVKVSLDYSDFRSAVFAATGVHDFEIKIIEVWED